MGIGIVTVTKQFEGERWTNVHGIRVGVGLTPLTVDDLITLGAEQAFNETTLAPAADVGSLAGTYFLHSLVCFERFLHASQLDLVRIYVSDGLENDPGTDSVFFAADFLVEGLNPVSDEEDIAPGAVVLQMNKQPASLSVRTGRNFYRGVLTDGDVKLGGPNLIEFTNASVLSGLSTLTANAIVDSGLEDYLVSGAAAPDPVYGIPRYQGKLEPAPGALKEVVPCSALEPVRPAIRQTRRGKRQST